MHTVGKTGSGGIVLLILALVLASQAASLAASPYAHAMGTNYYVDGTNGSDSNPGTSPDQAWRTIQKAAATVVAGDTCIVLPGQHDERVQITMSGDPSAPITYEAEGTVVTQGFTVRADYITIRSFEVTDTPDLAEDGVGIFVQGSHCIIEDNYVHYATRGRILIYAEPGGYAL